MFMLMCIYVTVKSQNLVNPWIDRLIFRIYQCKLVKSMRSFKRSIRDILMPKFITINTMFDECISIFIFKP